MIQVSLSQLRNGWNRQKASLLFAVAKYLKKIKQTLGLRWAVRLSLHSSLQQHVCVCVCVCPWVVDRGVMHAVVAVHQTPL